MVSCQETLDSDGFLTLDVTYDPCKWTNMVSEAGIEPSCVGIGQKLISEQLYNFVYVDQKDPTAMVMSFRHFLLCDLGLYGSLQQLINGYVFIDRR